jgi:hypothetical protein
VQRRFATSGAEHVGTTWNPFVAALLLSCAAVFAAIEPAAAETVALIGTGNVGSALGRRFAEQGHTVVVLAEKNLPCRAVDESAVHPRPSRVVSIVPEQEVAASGIEVRRPDLPAPHRFFFLLRPPDAVAYWLRVSATCNPSLSNG